MYIKKYIIQVIHKVIHDDDTGDDCKKKLFWNTYCMYIYAPQKLLLSGISHLEILRFVEKRTTKIISNHIKMHVHIIKQIKNI